MYNSKLKLMYVLDIIMNHMGFNLVLIMGKWFIAYGDNQLKWSCMKSAIMRTALSAWYMVFNNELLTRFNQKCKYIYREIGYFH